MVHVDEEIYKHDGRCIGGETFPVREIVETRVHFLVQVFSRIFFILTFLLSYLWNIPDPLMNHRRTYSQAALCLLLVLSYLIVQRCLWFFIGSKCRDNAIPGPEMKLNYLKQPLKKDCHIEVFQQILWFFHNRSYS